MYRLKSTLVKICGLTSYADAKLALDSGADALGFNFFHASPRCLSVGEAQAIVRRIPPTVWRVGVFVNHGRDEVERIARRVGLDTLQFHGDETVEFCKGWAEWRVVRAIRAKPGIMVDAITPYQKLCDHLLFDGFSGEEYGGTGVEIDSSALTTIVNSGILKTGFLAGGLTPANVGEKIIRLKPYGVDVSSGIEEAPGRKSPNLLRAFIEAAKNALQN